MSRTTEIAYENALKTQFNFKDKHTIEVMDASILWPDFTGRVTEYNKVLGEKRSFNLVLNPEMLEALRQIEEVNGSKFRIKSAKLHSEDDMKDPNIEKIYYINVKVNMDPMYQPPVTLFTEYRGKKSRQSLDAATVGILDSADIKTADMLLNIYINKKHPEQCTAYLKKLNVIQEPDAEFGGRYDDWEEVNGEETELVDIPDQGSDITF